MKHKKPEILTLSTSPQHLREIADQLENEGNVLFFASKFLYLYLFNREKIKKGGIKNDTKNSV